MFSEALQSATPHLEKFRHVIVSINGFQEGTDAQVAQEWLDANSISNCTIVVTGRELNPVSHSFFALSQLLKLGASLDDQVMDLYHDDWLLDVPKVQKNDVLLGPWEVSRDGDVNVQVALGTHGFRNPSTWISSFSFHRIFTNASGMVAPLKVRLEVIEFMNSERYLPKGVRFEYFLATHKDVSRICQSSSPMVRVRAHQGQASANLSRLHYSSADVAFLLWLVANKRISPIRNLPVVLYLLSSASLHYLRHLLDLVQPKFRRG